MLTTDQEKAIASLVDAATEAVEALTSAPCLCHDEFVCSCHKATRELAGAVLEVELAFVTEPSLHPVTVYHWSTAWADGGRWEPSMRQETPLDAKFRAGSMAIAFPWDRWAWTDENGQLHEVTREEAK